MHTPSNFNICCLCPYFIGLLPVLISRPFNHFINIFILILLVLLWFLIWERVLREEYLAKLKKEHSCRSSHSCFSTGMHSTACDSFYICVTEFYLSFNVLPRVNLVYRLKVPPRVQVICGSFLKLINSCCFFPFLKFAYTCIKVWALICHYIVSFFIYLSYLLIYKHKSGLKLKIHVTDPFFSIRGKPLILRTTIVWPQC